MIKTIDKNYRINRKFENYLTILVSKKSHKKATIIFEEGT